jgi:hypothetical protein
MATQDATIPFYLRPSLEVAPLETVPMISFDYDYSYIKEVNPSGGGLWANIADSVDSGVNTVFDKTAGVWKSVKSEIVQDVQALGGTFEGIIQKLKDNVLYAIIIGLVVIYFVAKSGILKQVAGVMR